MPKSQITVSAIDQGIRSQVPRGTYDYPVSMTFNSTGTLIAITTSSGASLNQITGNTGSIVVSPTSGSAVIGLDTAGSSGTYNNIFSLNVDDRGRVRSVSTFTDVINSGTYVGITSLSVDSYGRITNVTTGSIYSTGTNVTLKNCTLSGTSTFYLVKELIGFYYDSNNPVVDLNQGIRVWYMTSGVFTPSFINVPLVLNSIVTTSVIYQSGLSGSYINTASTYLVNGNTSTVSWANGQWPRRDTSNKLFTFSFYWSGSTTTVYSSFTEFF
jgi:hypothetical protein